MPMGIMESSARQELLSKIAAFSPLDVAGFNRFLNECIEELFGTGNVSRIEYNILLPSKLAFLKELPRNIVVFEDRENTQGTPFLFSYPFERDGKITFSITGRDKCELASDDKRELDVIFQMLFHILSTLILSSSCEELMRIDIDTNIPNLKAFYEFANRIIVDGTTSQYTALHFNIRNFRSVQKSLNYMESTKLLYKYCQMVTNAVSRREYIARLGGDNFMALILDINREYFFDLIQNMVLKFQKGEQEFIFPFGATIGAAKLEDERSIGEIMMHTSTAYQAARENRTMLYYYNHQMAQELIERKAILLQFANALKHHNFIVLYQPQIEANTHKLIGAEALVRWKQDDGYVMPGLFIPVLEKDGCITELDFYMLEQVCGFLRELIDQNMDPVKISVNFSKRHLTNNKLVEEIVNVVDRYRVPHEYVVIELTESEDYADNSVMTDVTKKLNLRGIRTSIDDFGTGYSSLSLINTLQVDELKIDRSFIPKNKVAPDNKKVMLLRGIVNLTKGLGLKSVVEGIETTSQLELIENMGCDIIQGYLFDKPLEKEVFIDRIKNKYYSLEGGGD